MSDSMKVVEVVECIIKYGVVQKSIFPQSVVFVSSFSMFFFGSSKKTKTRQKRQ